MKAEMKSKEMKSKSGKEMGIAKVDLKKDGKGPLGGKMSKGKDSNKKDC